jgi:hypothetical protein
MAQLIPGIRSGSTMGDFNFAVGSGVPFNVNGTRSEDTLVTMDGAPAVRTRANGAVIDVPNVDAAEEIQVMTTRLCAGVRTRLGRADPRGEQVRHQGFSRQPVRIFAQLGDERQHLVEEPKHPDQRFRAFSL